jgi:hypothetical protein
LQNQIKEKLLLYPLLAPIAGKYSKDATALVSIIKNMAEGAEKTQLKQAYADSLKIIWVVMCALAGAALIASCFTKGYSLEQEHTTQQGYHEGERTPVDLEGSAASARGVDEIAVEKARPEVQ